MNANDPEYRAFAQDIVWSLAITRDMSKDENIIAVIKMAFRTSELFWSAWELEQKRLSSPPKETQVEVRITPKHPGFKRKPKRNSQDEGEWSPV
jgi:hypothetical protein